MALNSGSSSAFDTLASELQPVLAQRLSASGGISPRSPGREPAEPTSDGRPTLSLRVRGAVESQGLSYSLEASEQIAIRLDKGYSLTRNCWPSSPAAQR